MKKLLLVVITLVLVIEHSQAQYIRCGTDEHMATLNAAFPSNAATRSIREIALREMILANPGYRVADVVTIPVVFHVLYYSAAQNISDSRIYEQLNVMNDDYSRTNTDAANTRFGFQPVAVNTQIQFCLARRTPQGTATNGILRIQTASSTLSGNPNDISPEWDHTRYLNVYIANLSNNVLGYSNFPPGSPGNDHTVVLYSSIGGPDAPGTLNPYHLGRTLVHEVGHWLNLLHTFEGGCSGINANACNDEGDEVCDTPPLSGPTTSCPLNNPNTCSETAPFPPPYLIDMVNQFENYMDYSFDVCMNMFSQGQATRMNSAIVLYRPELLTSDGCIPVPGSEVFDYDYLAVSPNPSSGFFELRFKLPVDTQIDLTIYDITGRHVLSTAHKNSMYQYMTIDLSALSAGVYQMLVKTSGGSMVKQLVIHHSE